MGKKKRQSEPNMDDDNDSTESCDENQNGFSCSHVAKGVDLSRIKKSIRNGLSTQCLECEKNPIENEMPEDEFEYDVSLWLCLRCGNQGCSRSKRKHALSHYKVPHSDCHALCVNTSIWNVWCYECDNMINPSSKKKLLEAVEYLKKQTVVNISQKPIALDYPIIETSSTNNYRSNISNSQHGSDLPRVRGLTNLGNTCFFNAVMQCLGQTPFLLPVLQEMSTPGERFTLPGGKFVASDKAQPPMEGLPPMEGQLSEWGTLTQVLCNTLKELATGQMDVYNPRSLLSQLTSILPQFGGGDQHDSHELLRHLLEAVRTEDLRRYQTVILDKLGFSTKTDPSIVEGSTKQIIKFYGQQASDLMVRTDQVFRGVLVSTLQCQDCKHSSHRDEFFLDLSLPVIDKPVPPAYRRKSDAEIMESEKPSKYQLKKEKRAAHKARKQHHKSSAGGTTIVEEQTSENKSESDESDADIEDNIEDCRSPGGCEDPGKGLESGYNSEKVSDASPELNASEMDSGVTSPLTVNVPSPMCAEADSPSSGSSEANIEMSSPQMPALVKSDFQNPEDYERPISRLSFTDKPTPMDVSTDKPYLPPEPVRMEYRWSGTLSARYQCDEGECSVQSCLNQFTACEMMTGNNRVGCDNCTKQINGQGGKTVYTNATKQLLISSPPAILILHLKRFQIAARCFPRKIAKHVPFPTILDMAPFCSSRCHDLPSIHDEQSRILYSLYGIVEHSGNLHGGHYVAYVKVRPQIPRDSYRWHFLSKPNVKTEKFTGLDGAQGDPVPPPGKWYYVSDSYVAEVPESKVLNAQAYLLFYERIL